MKMLVSDFVSVNVCACFIIYFDREHIELVEDYGYDLNEAVLQLEIYSISVINYDGLHVNCIKVRRNIE